MVSINWCLKTKNGLELIEPNDNMSNSYMRMAEESIKVLSKIENSNIWTATTSYYIIYYSLYSLMLKIGVKCEIHSCSIEFMKQLLREFYTPKDAEMIELAFKARIDLQYYSNRPVDESLILNAKVYCKDFYVKTKEIISRISEDQIKIIRQHLRAKLN